MLEEVGEKKKGQKITKVRKLRKWGGRRVERQFLPILSRNMMK